MGNAIQIYRGNNRTVSLTVYQPDGKTAYNLANCAVTLYIKKRINQSNSDAIITKTGTITQAANGVVEFYFLPADTNDAVELKDDVDYFYDVEVVNSSYSPAKQYTAVRARFRIMQP